MKIKLTITIFTQLFIFLSIFSACSDIPDEVEDTLDKAGDNRSELEQVIKHYKTLGDKEKLQAAYFLIENMKYKYGLYYSDYDFYLNLSNKCDSLYDDVLCSYTADKYVAAEMDKHIKTPRPKPRMIPDMYIITAEFLKNNIDMAFFVWKTKPWAQHLTFDEFCEWILPYRLNKEPLKPWRKYYYEKFKKLEKLVKKTDDPKNIGMIINDEIGNNIVKYYSLDYKKMPYFSAIDMLKLKIGVCQHRYFTITLALRSMGVPAAIDFTYQYNWKKPGGHSWTVLLGKDKTIKPFNAGNTEIEFFEPAACPMDPDGIRKITTAFRQKYGVDKKSLVFEGEKNLPINFTNPFIEDVTYQYEANENRTFVVKIDEKENGNYAFLFTFGKGIKTEAVSSAKVINGTARFTAGKDGVYFSKILSDGMMKSSGQAFLINNKGRLIPIIPDTAHCDTVVLYRKYPANIFTTDNHLVQGSNRADFKTYKTIYMLPEFVTELKKIPCNTKGKYRYYRYYSPIGTPDIRISSVNLYYKENNEIKKIENGNIFGYIRDTITCDDKIMQNAFDGDIRTNFNAPNGSWVVIDAGKPVKLVTLSVMPRSSFNIVEPGHLYELLYFNSGKWISLGNKIATENHIIYNNVPSGATLLLRDLTTGSEERRFMYKNKKQIWEMFYSGN